MRKLMHFGMIAALLALTALPAGAVTKRKTKHPAPDSNPAPAIAPKLDPAGTTPRTRAESVVVVDALTGQVLYEKNADQQRPPASTQKLLTALVLLDSGDLNQKLKVQASDTQVEPVKLGFKAGEVYTRRELLEVLLVHSVNDVACALARDNAGSVAAFAEKMNAKALELGMRHSHFVNPNGLPASDQYSTARDMTRLALAAYRSSTLRSIVATKTLSFRFASGRVEEFRNTNLILRNYPYCTGMKTGYTQAAGHCLVSSGSNNGREVIAVVLGDRNRSWLWQDSCSLLAWGLSL
ncbi:MAG: D-alanyl-D-alanine carboxypeptidase [Verrucomicrobia bacterium]|nr:D-alanyl-D-alanine carboxypeptidase [Verrucomicrobiota bacterium]